MRGTFRDIGWIRPRGINAEILRPDKNTASSRQSGIGIIGASSAGISSHHTVTCPTDFRGNDEERSRRSLAFFALHLPIRASSSLGSRSRSRSRWRWRDWGLSLHEPFARVIQRLNDPGEKVLIIRPETCSGVRVVSVDAREILRVAEAIRPCRRVSQDRSRPGVKLVGHTERSTGPAPVSRSSRQLLAHDGAVTRPFRCPRPRARVPVISQGINIRPPCFHQPEWNSKVNLVLCIVEF